MRMLPFFGIFVFFSGTASAHAAFSDIADTHPNFDAIEYAREEGIVKGYDDGTFRPQDFINRAEFTKIIVEAVVDRKVIDACTSASFTDVPAGEWFSTYVCAAKKGGLIDGYPDGTFKPGSRIVFSEAAKIVANAFELETEANERVWYKPFVDALAEKKAVPLSIFAFDSDVTRGEMAEMAYRLDAEVTTKKSLTYPAISQNVQPSEITPDIGSDPKGERTDAEYYMHSAKPYYTHFSLLPVCECDRGTHYDVYNQLKDNATCPLYYQTGEQIGSVEKREDGYHLVTDKWSSGPFPHLPCHDIRILADGSILYFPYDPLQDREMEMPYHVSPVYKNQAKLPYDASLKIWSSVYPDVMVSRNNKHFGYIGSDGKKEFMVLNGSRTDTRDVIPGRGWGDTYFTIDTVTNEGAYQYQYSEATDLPYQHKTTIVQNGIASSCLNNPYGAISENGEHRAFSCSESIPNATIYYLTLDGTKHTVGRETEYYSDRRWTGGYTVNSPMLLRNDGLLLHAGYSYPSDAITTNQQERFSLHVVGSDIRRNEILRRATLDLSGDVFVTVIERDGMLYVKSTADGREMRIDGNMSSEHLDLSMASPDGRNTAVITDNAKPGFNGDYFIFINGVKKATGDHIYSPLYTQDGKYAVYVVSNGQTYVRHVERLP